MYTHFIAFHTVSGVRICSLSLSAWFVLGAYIFYVRVSWRAFIRSLVLAALGFMVPESVTMFSLLPLFPMFLLFCYLLRVSIVGVYE